MKQLILFTFSILLMSACTSSSKLNYPATTKENVVDNYFGTAVPEPYRWLENDTSAATEAWVKAQKDRKSVV